MRYVTTWVQFTDLATAGDAGVCIHYAHNGHPSIALFLVLTYQWDIEGSVSIDQANALLVALRDAIDAVFEKGAPRTENVVTIPCADSEGREGGGAVTVREGEASVMISMTDQPSPWTWTGELAMGQEEATAVLALLQAAVRWTSERHA